MKFYTESSLGKTRHLTPEGFLVVESVPIARIGTMDYAADEVPGIESLGGMVKMSRTEDELFNAETISSFEGKPIIIPSGDVHANGIDADSWGDHAVGHMQGVRRGTGDMSDYLVADLVINDSTAIERVNNGLRELSCGYEYIARQVSQGQGEQYDIRGNHVALVDRARGGSNLKIGDKGNLMKIKNPMLRLFAHAVKAGDEEAQKDIEEKLEEEEIAGDEIDPSTAKIEALETKIDKLIEVISALVSTDKAVHAEAGDSDDEDDDDTMKAGDSEWQSIISGAAIVAPDLVIDKKASIGDEMARVVASAKGEHVKRMIGDSVPSKLNKESLLIAFNSIVETQKALNNAKQTAGDSMSSGLTFSGLDDGGFTIVGR